MKHLALFSILLILAGCGFADKAKEAQKDADVFHTLLKEQNVDGMMKMVHPEGLNISPEEDWRYLFEAMAEYEIKEVKKTTGFKTEINNGVTDVELTYTLKGEAGNFEEKLVLRSMGDSFYILGCQVN